MFIPTAYCKLEEGSEINVWTDGFMVLFTAVCVFLFLGICRPLEAYWDVGVQGTCLSDRQVESVIFAQGGSLPS